MPKGKSKKAGKKKGKGKGTPAPTDFTRRTRYPQGNELIGVVIRNFGARRMEVLCQDQVKRNARIPGKFRRGYRITVGDVVLVEPWEYGGNEKGDVVYKYRPAQVAWLKKKGHIKEVTVDLEEF